MGRHVCCFVKEGVLENGLRTEYERRNMMHQLGQQASIRLSTFMLSSWLNRFDWVQAVAAKASSSTTLLLLVLTKLQRFNPQIDRAISSAFSSCLIFIFSLRYISTK